MYGVGRVGSIFIRPELVLQGVGDARTPNEVAGFVTKSNKPQEPGKMWGLVQIKMV